MLTKIERLVQEFKQSIIQSEAEVRSKFIVPLLEILEYPTFLRAEEFPVYGFEGGKQLPAKNADFLLFTDKEFAMHRKCTQKNLEWVQKNSLLVVEAKKPGEMPDILGQPQYYTVWTKSVAYLAIDGLSIKGYYFNNIYPDRKIIDCSLEELSTNADILAFAYNEILNIKEKAISFPKQPFLLDRHEESKMEEVRPATEDDIKNLPQEVFMYMRDALGRNSEGLSDMQVIGRFLNMTNAYLENGMRYDIPQYMFNFPRKFLPAQLSINKDVFPIETGKVVRFYQNDFDRYLYESKYITIDIMSFKGKHMVMNIGFSVQNRNVASRLGVFEKIQRVFTADSWKISFSDPDPMVMTFDLNEDSIIKVLREETVSRYEIYREDLERLRLIEDFYEVEFELFRIPPEKVNELQRAIYDIYAGITMECNCEITLPSNLFGEEFELDSHMPLEDDISAKMDPITLFGKTFVPSNSWILPFSTQTITHQVEGVISVPGCIRYAIKESAK